MSRRANKAVAIVIAILAMAAPVVLAIYLANAQAHAREQALLLQFARAAVHRTDTMLDHVNSAFREMEAADKGDACSAEQLALMRHLDLASAYIQAVGHMEGNILSCSSMRGPADAAFDLGPPDAITPRGIRLRFDAVFPFAPEHRFLVLQHKRYAAIIHRDLIVEPPTDDPRVSVATFSTSSGRVASSHGTVRPEWIAALRGRKEAVFTEGGYEVAVVVSKRYYSGALAAVPEHAVLAQTRAFAWLLVPIGALGGLLFALAVVYVARLQQGMPALIRSGLRRGEFFLVYQPIVELGSGRCVGAEALLRWRRSDGEMVRPDVFIQAAEDSGLIRKITERVIELLARDAGALFRAQPDFHLSLNLSSADLQCEGIVDALAGLAARTGAGPGNLVVEATERGFLHDGVAAGIVRTLRQRGFKVAVDDFGTGYSSLSYLHSFELDYLKIDKSFVDTIGAGAATSQVVAHIIDMARDLQLGMIAEGVEQRAQADYLHERGVQYAQGWLFGKPMPLAELLARFEPAPLP